MTTNEALRDGARRILGHKKLVAFYYFVNLAAAAVIVAPLAAIAASRLATSLESERLFSNLDMAWVAETLLLYKDGAVVPVIAAAAITGTFFFLVQTFFAGGAIAVLCREEETFFGAAARYYPRLLRLLLVSAVFYAVVLAIGAGLNAAIGKARESSMEAWPWTVANWARLALMVILGGFVNMVFDYAKILMIAEDRRGAVRAAGRAFRFALGNAARTLGIYWTCALIGLLILAAYHGLSEAVGQNTKLAVAVVFVLRQLCMLARMWARLWTWASEVSFYSAMQPAPAPLAPEPSPVSLPELPPEPEITPEVEPAG